MEIPKFRVWHRIKEAFHPQTKEWTYSWQMSDVQILNLPAREVTLDSKHGFANRLSKIGEHCILMQSIGITDRNNKSIYIGDVVTVNTRDGVYTGVVEQEGAVRRIRTPETMLTNLDDYTIEVTGHIYADSGRHS